MPKKPEKRDSGLFGNLFDLNGDGVTDCAEAALMFAIFDEMEKSNQKKQAKAAAEKIVDIDDLDIDGI